MNFGQAIESLKAGKRVCRSGWNGKGMWLWLEHGKELQSSSNPQMVDFYGKWLPWIGMKTADGAFVPWLASQTDMLAEDWEIVK